MPRYRAAAVAARSLRLSSRRRVLRPFKAESMPDLTQPFAAL
jgi:hypothetical protein